MEEGTEGVDVRAKKTLVADSLLPAGRVWRHGLCPLGLGKNVLKGIREKLAKQLKKEEMKAPLL